MLAPSNPFPQGSPVEGLPRNEKLQPQLLACRDAEEGESEEEYRVMCRLAERRQGTAGARERPASTSQSEAL